MTNLYCSVRRDGRVTSEYVAGGEYAELIAMARRWSRDMRRLSKPDDGEDRRRQDELERVLDDLVGRSQDLARSTLEAAGYHQHKRGEWRKRRGTPS
jgi:hypothetical protein